MLFVTVTTLSACLFAILQSSLSFATVMDGFDYIIVGGGTAGLTVANRLTELPDIKVAVIEAGDKVFDNPNVTTPELFTVTLGTSIDWQYESTPQTYAGGKTIACSAGKALGGMTWVRGEKSQIDAWGAIGNKGWSWDELLPYYKKSENFTVPSAAQLEAGASYHPSDHGESGPLKTGYPFGLQNGSLHETVATAWGSLGMPPILDANGGHVRGFTVWQSTVDRDANIREDAARAFYYPFQDRPNLYIFLNTTANRIVWSDASEDAVAEGVEITSSYGIVSVIRASREVIISAGSYRSPTILELSGIGNPSILETFGISNIVDLPSVGENLMDQPNNVLIYNSSTIFNGTTSYVAYGNTTDFDMELPSDDDLSVWAEKVAAANDNAVNASSLEYLFKVQSDLIRYVPNAESIFSTGKTFGYPPSVIIATAFWLLMPFSRGSVHINSSDPLAYPTINPNYFTVDYDLKTQAAIAKWTRSFWMTSGMRDLATEISPGYDILPGNATDAQYAEWVKTTFSSNSHPLGTAAMMPRELGGVVDSSLKVYGTKNVRVVDASVMPFQMSGHLTATIYAIAEKAADLIKADIK
ncbi:Glucose oxidase [Lachnellula suecica]|uniref:Glucose oxidase n=1 Tax=Lachnellula suecica TaxID=602035 RepID=A0A8T9CC44_9HELO|nr:Glucose oxidase [Lachnellula suecica]